MTPRVIAGCEVSQSTAFCDVVLSLQPFVALDPGHFSSFRWRFGRGCATSHGLRDGRMPISRDIKRPTAVERLYMADTDVMILIPPVSCSLIIHVVQIG